MSASPSYRVYCYDSARNILSAEWIEAENDADAVAQATAAGFGSQCEIWEGTRLVAQLTGEQRTA